MRIEIRTNAKTHPMQQYGFLNAENHFPAKTPQTATKHTPIVSSQGSKFT